MAKDINNNIPLGAPFHATNEKGMAAHADEVYLDGYNENTASGDVTNADNVESAIKKLSSKAATHDTAIADAKKAGTDAASLAATNKTTVDNYTVNGKKVSTNPVIDKEDVGLDNVDNTSDLDKPVSTATQTALDKKQNVLGNSEDIIIKDGKTYFADRTVDAANFQSRGRVYLRKNIVDGKNVLTQDMINQADTTYVIMYDFDLNGQTITIPSGCTLEFDNGSISNGELIGNDTKLYKYSNTNIKADLFGVFTDKILNKHISNYFKLPAKSDMLLSYPFYLNKGGNYANSNFKFSNSLLLKSLGFDFGQIVYNTTCDENGDNFLLGFKGDDMTTLKASDYNIIVTNTKNFIKYNIASTIKSLKFHTESTNIDNIWSTNSFLDSTQKTKIINAINNYHKLIVQFLKDIADVTSNIEYICVTNEENNLLKSEDIDVQNALKSYLDDIHKLGFKTAINNVSRSDIGYTISDDVDYYFSNWYLDRWSNNGKATTLDDVVNSINIEYKLKEALTTYRDGCTESGTMNSIYNYYISSNWQYHDDPYEDAFYMKYLYYSLQLTVMERMSFAFKTYQMWFMDEKIDSTNVTSSSYYPKLQELFKTKLYGNIQ